jgi:hypothetical protein
MADARAIYCGLCESKVRPKRQWSIATIEPPHLGGPEAAHLAKRRRPARNELREPDLSGYSTLELLQVDGRCSQFDISIRQYVRDGVTVKEDEELGHYMNRFPSTNPGDAVKQHETQMKYLFTDKSTMRLGYRQLEVDAEEMVVLTCPYCRFHRRLKLQFIAKQYNNVLDTGGRLVLSSSGLELRGGGMKVSRPPKAPKLQ